MEREDENGGQFCSNMTIFEIERRKRGLNTDQTAELLGLSKSTVNAIEKRQRKLTMDYAQAFSEKILNGKLTAAALMNLYTMPTEEWQALEESFYRLYAKHAADYAASKILGKTTETGIAN